VASPGRRKARSPASAPATVKLAAGHIDDAAREEIARVERTYTDDMIASIAKTLKFRDDQARARFPGLIRDWAAGVAHAREVTDSRHRPAFEALASARTRVQNAAAELLQAYRDYAEIDPAGGYDLTLNNKGRPPGFFEITSDADRSLLRVVLEYLERWAAIEPSPRRRNPRSPVARDTAIFALMHIYMDTTGERPSLIKDASGFYGHFLDFCRDALRPIEGADVERSLAARINYILYPRK
jgi:hypothetical protein